MSSINPSDAQEFNASAAIKGIAICASFWGRATVMLESGAVSGGEIGP
jgi:hypothetical protein